MYFHWQNLNDSIPKRYWLHGRCWLGRKIQWNLEWAFPSRDFRLVIGLNDYGEKAFCLSVAFYLFSFYIGLEWKPLYNFLEKLTRRSGSKYTNGRKIGASYHGGTLWIDLWNDPMDWRSSDPKWWKFSVDFRRLLQGTPVHSLEVLEEREILIPMPERSYPATATRLVRRWTYPRWPTQERMEVEIKVPEGVPFEGKGENSWDCGQDAVFSMSSDSQSIPEAVGKFVGSVLKDRVRNGGWGDWNWQKKPA